MILAAFVCRIVLAFAFFAVLVAGSPARAADPAPPAVPPAAPPADVKPAEDVPPPDPNEQTAKRLQKKITVDFKDTPLRDVLDAVRDQAGVDLVVQWPALEAAGLDPAHTLTLRLKDARPAEVVLQVINRALGGLLTIEMDQGVVFIAAAPRAPDGPPAPPAMTMLTYDIADLIRDKAAGTEDEQSAKLVGVITQVLEPESWKTSGGAGVIVAYRGKLFVRTTEAVHQAIGQFIIGLRQGAKVE